MMQFSPIPDGTTYEQYSFNLISLFEGFVSTAYVDSVGHPTIGYGFDLTDTTIYDAVMAVVAPAMTAAQRQAFYDAVIDQPYAPNATPILTAAIAKYTGAHSEVPANFALTKAQSVAIFTAQANETYEKRIDAWLPGIPDSIERSVLLSLSYNGLINAKYDKNGNIIGYYSATLRQDIISGNRADAWYQIRYLSNGTPGIDLSNRRYVESERFGLYADHSTNPIATDQEAVQAGQMYAANQDTIEGLEDDYAVGGVNKATIANNNYQLTGSNIVHSLTQSFQPAIVFLENEYHLTFGSAALDGSLQRLIVDYIPSGASTYTNALQGTDDTNDMIIGMGGGNEVITGTKGNDLIYGGTGTNNTLDFSAYSSELDVTSGNSAGGNYLIVDSLLSVTHTAAYDIETLKLGDGYNTVNMSLNAASVLQNLYTGNGTDSVNITGVSPLNLYLGSGNDTVTATPSNSTITLVNGGTATIDGNDTIVVASSDTITVAADANGNPVNDTIQRRFGSRFFH